MPFTPGLTESDSAVIIGLSTARLAYWICGWMPTLSYWMGNMDSVDMGQELRNE